MHYTEHFSNEKIMTRFIRQHGPIQLKRETNLCLYLCSSIISQQLSIKVADVIYKRFLALYNGHEPAPADIVATPVTTLRGIGFSNAKASYVHNVARFALEQGMEHEKIDAMPDEAVIEYLTAIKGVGRWTVEMLLMFALGREDVFAVDDLGIQNAMIRYYKFDKSDRKQLKLKMITKAKKWSPYRTYACMHLWQSLVPATLPPALPEKL